MRAINLGWCMTSLLALGLIPLNTLAAFKVLVYTEAYTLVHKSIPAGVQCVKELGAANGFTVDTSSSASVMTPSNLSKYAAIVFMNTYGAIMNQISQQQAFKGFINAGGGWVGVHGPNNCFTSWPWYGGLLGNNAWRKGQTFGKFPNVRESKTHFIVKDLPDTITLNDEYFGYEQNPRSGVTMLYSAKMNDNADHPSAWCHEYDGGRAVYGVWGQYDTTFADPNYRKFLLKSIQWAAKQDVPVSIAKTQNQQNLQPVPGRTFAALMGKFVLPNAYAGKTVTLSLFGIDGKFIRSLSTGNQVIDLSRERELHPAAIIVKITAIR
jgi:type 1 glutamine amidotransferase